MAYEKLNLKDGVVLNQNHFAHIEEGIVNAENRPNISLNANVGSGNDTTISVLSTDNNEVICGASLKAVRYDSQPGLTEEQKAQARENIGAASVDEIFELPSINTSYSFDSKDLTLKITLGDGTPASVKIPLLTYKYDLILSSLEKSRARNNIGAASVNEVLVLGEQTLTEAQKAQARENIGAASVEEVLAALPVYAGEVEAV